MAQHLNFLLTWLCAIIHVANGYNYTYAGLVASSVVAFVVLLIAVGILIVLVTWESWYPKFMYNRGKVKVPREPKVKRRPVSMLNGGFSYPESVGRNPSTYGSSRIMTNGKASSTRPILLTESPREGLGDLTSNKTDSWIQEISTPRYDENSQKIDFEEEEEEVIVTELIDIDTGSPAVITTHQPIGSDDRVPSAAQKNILSKTTTDFRADKVTGSKQLSQTVGGDFYFGAESGDEDTENIRAKKDDEEKMVLY